MRRTVLRHIVCALAVVLLYASVRGPAAAQTQIDPPSLQLSAGSANTTAEPKTAAGLATKQGHQPKSPDLSRDYQARSNILKTK